MKAIERNLIKLYGKSFRVVKDNFYIDAFIKKTLEAACRKIFIYGGVFFGEKYLMEKLGPKLIEGSVGFFKNIFYNDSLTSGDVLH